MPTLTNTVYVIQQPRPRKSDGWEPNMQPATEYGKIQYVFDGGDRAYADPKGALAKARIRLKDFNPDNDYLLWPNAGDPACVWVVIMVLMKAGHNKLRFLYWSRGRINGQMSNENGFYVPIEIDTRY